MSRKTTGFTIYDSRDTFDYDDYVDWCNDNNIEPAGEDSTDYWDWVSETNNAYYDDMMSNLSHTKIDCPLMIVGDLGLWNGRRTIRPVPILPDGYSTKYKDHVPTMKAAIKRCCEGRSTLDVDVHYEDGHIKVCEHHHDGTNTFYIRKLSKKGIKGMEAAERRYEDCNPKEWWFSKIRISEIDF